MRTVSLKSMMRAISIKNFGGPEVCEFVENLPIPDPNDDQVTFFEIFSFLSKYRFYLII